MSDSVDMSHVDPRFLTTTSTESSVASANLTYGSGGSSVEPGTVYGSESDLAFDDSTHGWNLQPAAEGQFHLPGYSHYQQQAQQHEQQLSHEVPDPAPGCSTANAFGPSVPGLPLRPSANQDFGHHLDHIPAPGWMAAAGRQHVTYYPGPSWSTPSASSGVHSQRSGGNVPRQPAFEPQFGPRGSGSVAHDQPYGTGERSTAGRSSNRRREGPAKNSLGANRQHFEEKAWTESEDECFAIFARNHKRGKYRDAPGAMDSVGYPERLPEEYKRRARAKGRTPAKGSRVRRPARSSDELGQPAMRERQDGSTTPAPPQSRYMAVPAHEGQGGEPYVSLTPSTGRLIPEKQSSGSPELRS
ncbi:hypothetical protein KC353_g4548 [Hortaea werneckii]|nr:hypothetical protein KC353_g4548 [Hortaea werneckii]